MARNGKTKKQTKASRGARGCPMGTYSRTTVPKNANARLNFTNQREGGKTGFSIQPVGQSTLRVSGSHPFADVYGSAYPQQWPVAPITFAGTRIAPFFMIYEKWLVRNLSFHFMPLLGANQAGAIAAAGEYDPRDPIPLWSDANSVLRQYEGGKIAPLNQQHVIHMPNNFLTGGGASGMRIGLPLWCGTLGAERETTFGRLVANVSGDSVGDTIPVGYYTMTFEIDFLIPQYQPETAVMGSGTTVAAVTATGAIQSWLGNVADTDVLVQTCSDFVGTTVAMGKNRILRGLYDGATAGGSLEFDGQPVPKGTPIWIKHAAQVFDDAADTLSSSPVPTPDVARISLSSVFDDMSRWLEFTASGANEGFALKNPRFF